MESADSRYTYSTSRSSFDDGEAPAAHPVPNEHAVNAAFEQLCRDICLIYWSRARANTSARSLATARVQYKRKLDRLTMEEVLNDVILHLSIGHQRELRNIIFALRASCSCQWSKMTSRCFRIQVIQVSLISALQGHGFCPPFAGMQCDDETFQTGPIDS